MSPTDVASADGKKRNRSKRSAIDFRYKKELSIDIKKESKFHCSESKKKKRKKAKGDDDVFPQITINSLPDDILMLVLSLLKSTRQACRTTILSKRWKNLWTQLPSQDFFVTGPNEQFMFRYLALAPTKITKLSLKSNQKIPWISMLASSVAEHHVENLILKVYKCFKYVLPESFYSQPTLRSLRIRGGNFWRPGTVNWRALVVLKVWQTTFQGICNMGDILLGCPALECLMLRSVSISSMLSGPVLISHRKLKILSVNHVYHYTRENIMVAEVHVSTPQLEKLEISGRWRCISCMIIEDLPMLVESHLGFSLLFPTKSDPLYVAQKQQNNLKNLLEKVRYSKKLLLGDYCKQVYEDMNQAS